MRDGAVGRNLPELNLDVGYSIGELAFAQICREFRKRQPAIIVEFGSGRSTARLALEFPSTSIVSIESDEGFCLQTRALINNLPKAGRVQVFFRPLRWRLVGLGWILTYQDGSFPEEIDCVLIDGPPGWAYRGREGALYQVFGRLRVGGVVILDDYGRPGEQTAVSNWARFLGGAFVVHTSDISHGLAIIRKTAEVRHWPLRGRMLGIALKSWVRRARDLCGFLSRNGMRRFRLEARK